MVTRLSQIDANLLIALNVLLEERHVTRAARRLGVTQSAMSQTLQRLRDTLGDPLLVRSGTRMVTPPRADALAGPLRTSLQVLEQTLAGAPSFDPEASRTFRLATLDAYSFNILPQLLTRIVSAGSGLALDVSALEPERVWDQLREGELELAIVGPREVPPDIKARPLLRERMVAMVRAGHPLLEGPIDTESYVRWPHAVFRLTGRGEYPIDRRLSELGYERRVVGRSPFFLSSPWVVVTSDIIMTLPSSAAVAFAERWPVVLFEPPIGRPMVYTVELVWPNFLQNDPAHCWLREQLVDIASGMDTHANASFAR